MESIEIQKMCDDARYSECLEHLINDLGGEKVLRLKYESDYSGYVDIDVLLRNGKVFTYIYYYGSCSGCDDWEDRGLSDKQIMEEMKTEGTIFDNIDQYNKWRNNVENKSTCSTCKWRDNCICAVCEGRSMIVCGITRKHVPLGYSCDQFEK